MSSGAANNPDPNADNALLRRPYDPTTQGTAGQFSTSSPSLCPGFGISRPVTRTLYNVQRKVLRFPSYEFIVRVGALTVKQVRTARPSYVNAILIASRGVKTRGLCSRNTRSVFGEHVRIPGYWNGACAGCKWKDGGARCDFYAEREPKYVPLSVAELRVAPIEELED
ncbi:uncharacterized protein BDW70DRAFT_159803 [Aspergillus foveolatus]|uniref:uncharacterized protein n=1 Tax=Aspergillus foveolatus TaxID=210207 RepID=UPI003CCDB0D0